MNNPPHVEAPTGLLARLDHELDAWAKLGVDLTRSPRRIARDHGVYRLGAKCDGVALRNNECFTNSARFAQEHRGEWRYVEGVAYKENGIMIFDHGWLYNTREKCFYDPTWGASDDTEYLGVVFSLLGQARMHCRTERWDCLQWGQTPEEEVVECLEDVEEKLPTRL